VNGAAHRVVVTGIGIVSPIGTGVAAFWESALAGTIGVATLTRFDSSEFSSHVAAQVPVFDPYDFLERKQVARTDRYSQFAIAAAKLAIGDAAFDVSAFPSDVGMYIGSALGGLAFAEEQHDAYRKRGSRAVRPLLAISVFGAASTSNVAIAFGLSGPSVSNANARRSRAARKRRSRRSCTAPLRRSARCRNATTSRAARAARSTATATAS
jgi:3-oxoacyl-[acyl-carrier-protein] synthase II